MLFFETSNTPPSPTDAGSLHALWAQNVAEQPCTLQMHGVLRMLLKRLGVDTVLITLREEGGAVVKIRCGDNPLEWDCISALVACSGGGHTLCVFEAIEAAGQAVCPAQKTVRFYAGAPLFIAPGGDPVGALSLLAEQPKIFSETDRLVFRSAALAVSAMLVMPHNSAAATAIALSAEKSVVLINRDQAIEAVSQRFIQLTHLGPTDAQRMGVDHLLCLHREHAGAVVLGHALLVEIAAHGRTHCRTKSGSTLPVEVLVFPLPDEHNRVAKTMLLIVPIFKGRLDDFLSSLRPRERDELLELHIAGLWAVDSAGRILKITGAPIAHLGQSAHDAIVGQLLGTEGIFDVDETNWHQFYDHVAADNLPPEIE